MHIFTHLKKESEGKTGLGLYPDGMVEHDGHVGQLLKKLEDLGILDKRSSSIPLIMVQR
jgi:arylsulfatase A-like enzyme